MTFHRIHRALEVDAGIVKGETWRGLKLPLLREVLDVMPDGKRLYVELKQGPGLVDPVLAVVDAAGKGPDQIVFISFSIDAITADSSQAGTRMAMNPGLYAAAARASLSSGPTPSSMESPRCGGSTILFWHTKCLSQCFFSSFAVCLHQFPFDVSLYYIWHQL